MIKVGDSTYTSFILSGKEIVLDTLIAYTFTISMYLQQIPMDLYVVGKKLDYEAISGVELAKFYWVVEE